MQTGLERASSVEMRRLIPADEAPPATPASPPFTVEVESPSSDKALLVEGVIDDQTGGSHHDQIAKAGAKAEVYIDKNAASKDLTILPALAQLCAEGGG